MKKRMALILGNCLFPNHQQLKPDEDTLFVMIEDYGLCTHFRYHKHKLVLFLSAMRSHGDVLRKQYDLEYIKLEDKSSYESKLETILANYPELREVVTYDIEDHFFEDRIVRFCRSQQLNLNLLESPGFLTTKKQFKDYNSEAQKPFMHVFYQQQRKRLNVLLNPAGGPENGQWSFDAENRKKLPKNIRVPDVPQLQITDHTKDVIALVEAIFPDHLGDTENFNWATTREQALELAACFFNDRFNEFGPYEDAIDDNGVFLFHSVLSPYLNMGLITPKELLDAALAHYHKNNTHFPSVEGFVRQIIGWREFVRGIYHEYDDRLNMNYFNHHRKMKDCWYDGSTGIPPLDDSIRKVKKYGYTHHIERLMILGNLMLLSEIHPEHVYRWFMEMYVDSADWVMAPNVFGMSQFADGGIFATKPYIGGANYIRKMSRYGKGEWEDVVNGLYWRFIARNEETFAKNQRMSMMVSTFHKMNPEKKERILNSADVFIEKTTELI